ncbi:hypothetical protein WH285_13840 [Acinetobacter johnsonii]|uniref:hypothetical protein n=1 Tax=Acinetobacter johnsonii TaxID=40214 RepID=UPI0030B499B9
MIRRINLKLIKSKTGEELVLGQCTVQPNQIFSKDINTPVEKGDFIIRTLPSGIIEKYEVNNVVAYTSVLPHYELDVRKVD